MTGRRYDVAPFACGIVCEYDPFHTGHAYQIRTVRETLALPVVCAMSGEYVQRAHVSCMDKRERAAIAVKNGASVVLEIPFPYACMSAERFAAAGVAVLDGSGMCSHIAFGAECTDTDALTQLADYLLTKECADAVARCQKSAPNVSYAAARTSVLEKRFGAEAAQIITQPNNILAVEYIKAIRRRGSTLIPVALERTVSRADASDGVYASSSYIRTLIGEGRLDEARRFMPDECTPEIKTDAALCRAVFTALAVKKREAFADIAECGGGLGDKLYKALQKAGSYEQTLALMRCKTLTDAKIRRMMLFAYFGITTARAGQPVRYTPVLAYADTDEARALFALSRKNKTITVCASAAAIKHDKACASDYEAAEIASKMYRVLRDETDAAD